MDNKQIRKGASVLLPVFVEGAQLALGDAHAVMGDGESAHSGVETEVVATLRCELITHFRLNRPMVVTDSEVMTIAEGQTLNEASETALSEMAKLTMDTLHMTFGEAAMLISIIGDLRICQVINPLVTVRLALPRYVLSVL